MSSNQPASNNERRVVVPAGARKGAGAAAALLLATSHALAQEPRPIAFENITIVADENTSEIFSSKPVRESLMRIADVNAQTPSTGPLIVFTNAEHMAKDVLVILDATETSQTPASHVAASAYENMMKNYDSHAAFSNWASKEGLSLPEASLLMTQSILRGDAFVAHHRTEDSFSGVFIEGSHVVANVPSQMEPENLLSAASGIPSKMMRDFGPPSSSFAALLAVHELRHVEQHENALRVIETHQGTSTLAREVDADRTAIQAASDLDIDPDYVARFADARRLGAYLAVVVDECAGTHATAPAIEGGTYKDALTEREAISRLGRETAQVLADNGIEANMTDPTFTNAALEVLSQRLALPGERGLHKPDRELATKIVNAADRLLDPSSRAMDKTLSIGTLEPRTESRPIEACEGSSLRLSGGDREVTRGDLRDLAERANDPSKNLRQVEPIDAGGGEGISGIVNFSPRAASPRDSVNAERQSNAANDLVTKAMEKLREKAQSKDLSRDQGHDR